MPKVVSDQNTPLWFAKNEYLRAKIDVAAVYGLTTACWVRHKNDVTSKFKCKFYKHSGSPNLATITKFDELVKLAAAQHPTVEDLKGTGLH